jgi:hypothetical protein
MRTWALIPIALGIATACGLALCRALGISPHERELLDAAVTCLFASALAMIPIIVVRGTAQITVVQSALVGTAVHLFVCLAVAMVLVFGKFLTAQPYLFWMLAMYGSSLIVLVITFARTVRCAPVVQAPRQ